MQELKKRDVVIIATGGTFDKYYPEGKGVRDFKFPKRTAAHRILKRIRFEGAKVINLFAMDSLDMKPEDQERIAHECSIHTDCAIIITHGTDKMISTARCIAKRNLANPIVITGSSQPAIAHETDADTNLAGAIAVAQAVQDGVYIHMHGTTYGWNRCKKAESGKFESA